MFLNNAEQFVVSYFYIYTPPRLDKWKARMRLFEFIWMARTKDVNLISDPLAQ